MASHDGVHDDDDHDNSVDSNNVYGDGKDNNSSNGGVDGADGRHRNGQKQKTIY